ncbi:hypothetical protein [Legionella resiliens]|uniref:Uncharacterized protein n=1 Tax=Legionella resiliens TaxID=2905958 RepID=A0ABS8X7J6_9GAMM|nr:MULTISPECIES: hypothetical protein [unclassified Legionella]MCE0723540.1 hypothetical protein [Legionella sp. 9fVS26]MCE3532694.1 hypothetical protein [Legionella sp. 8cVS16]
MKNQQLRAIYTNPDAISEQTLLEQVKEFAEIGFNEHLKKFIESNKKNIKLFTSTAFDASKYSQDYLDFLNAMILVLSSAKTDINTRIIREKHAQNQHYSRQPKTKDEYPSIEDIEDSTLNMNVAKRLDAFKKELEALRNQQLVFKAKSLVNSARVDIDINQENLGLMKDDYLELLSNYSQESFVAFEKKFARLFAEKSILAFRKHFAERKLSMDGIVKECKGTSVEEVIKKEQSELNQQIINFELIMKQATDLKSLTTLLKQVKTIEGIITQKEVELLIPSDAQKLQEFIRLIEAKEQEIQHIKQGINGSSEIHQQTIQAIEKIEQSIRQKKVEAESLLQKISKTSSEVPQKRIDEEFSSPQELPEKSDPKNEETFMAKKNRLQEAISLIQTYRETIEHEQERFSVKFFHKSRNQAKISYCNALEKELKLQDKGLNFESNLHDIINNAHNKVTTGAGAQKEIITKGGSYFGTSRMLSLQRLLGIDEAWKMKGHSKILLFSTKSDLHGLKTSGLVGDDVENIVKNFFLEEADSDKAYQQLKEQVFPSAADKKLECL